MAEAQHWRPPTRIARTHMIRLAARMWATAVEWSERWEIRDAVGSAAVLGKVAHSPNMPANGSKKYSYLWIGVPK